MTLEEQQLLRDFLNQLVEARGTVKDPAADALIAKAVAEQPDAAYLLVQRAMLLQQALNSAKTQIAELERQVNAHAENGGFLNGAGWGRSPATPAPYTPTATPPKNRPSFFNSGAGGFLGAIAATAAGVAGGAFLFQGIESLLGHHGGGFLGQGSSREPVENTTINNYHSADQATGASGNDIAGESLLDSGFDDNIGGDDSSWI